jgi:hypothetical protein
MAFHENPGRLLRSLLGMSGSEGSGLAPVVSPPCATPGGDGTLAARFRQAVKQLRGSSLDARLTAIISLDCLASDSEPYAASVIDVLTAYVREHAPNSPGTSPTPRLPARPLPVEIQTILSVIGRRSPMRAGTEPIIDLTGVDIAGVNLAGANLEKAFLVGVDLSGANLSRARLAGASLVGARLEGADLSLAHLEGANLCGAVLEGATLAGVHLEDALLAEARLERVDLRWAHLEGVDLSGVVGLDLEQVSSAFVDQRTRLPAGRLTPELPAETPGFTRS